MLPSSELTDSLDESKFDVRFDERDTRPLPVVCSARGDDFGNVID